MSIRAKTYIANLIAVDSIVTVYYYHLQGRAGTTTTGDRHNFWEFQYVDKGTHHVLLDGVRYDLNEGQMILFAPNAHHCSAGEAFSAHVGIVSFESASPILQEKHAKVVTLPTHMRALLSDIVTCGVEMFVPVPPESGLKGVVPRKGIPTEQLQLLKHKLEFFLTEFCMKDAEEMEKAVGSNRSNYQKSQFDEIEDYLKANLSKNLSLEDMSSALSLSQSKLKKIFKEERSSSPIAYFNALKIQRAKQLIKESTLNVSQIAEALGFTYENYFSKVFKEKTGLTPSEYAKSIYKK